METTSKLTLAPIAPSTRAARKGRNMIAVASGKGGVGKIGRAHV